MEVREDRLTPCCTCCFKHLDSKYSTSPSSQRPQQIWLGGGQATHCYATAWMTVPPFIKKFPPAIKRSTARTQVYDICERALFSTVKPHKGTLNHHIFGWGKEYYWGRDKRKFSLGCPAWTHKEVLSKQLLGHSSPFCFPQYQQVIWQSFN